MTFVRLALASALVVGALNSERAQATDATWVGPARACRQKLACALAAFSPEVATYETQRTTAFYNQLCGEYAPGFMTGAGEGFYELYDGRMFSFPYPPATATHLPSVMEGGFQTYYQKARVVVSTSPQITMTHYIRYRRSCAAGETPPNCPYYYNGYAASLPAGIAESAVQTVTGTVASTADAQRIANGNFYSEIMSLKSRYSSFATDAAGPPDLPTARQHCSRIQAAMSACDAMTAPNVTRDVAAAYEIMGQYGCPRPPAAAAVEAPAPPSGSGDFASRASCGDQLNCIDQNARRSGYIYASSGGDPMNGPWTDPQTGAPTCGAGSRIRTYDTHYGPARLIPGETRRGSFLVQPDGRGFFVPLRTAVSPAGFLMTENGVKIGFPPEVPGETAPDGGKVYLIKVTPAYLGAQPAYMRVFRTSCGAGGGSCYQSLGAVTSLPAGIAGHYLPSLASEPVTESRLNAAMNSDVAPALRDLPVLTRMIRNPEADSGALFGLYDYSGNWQPNSSNRERTQGWRSSWNVAVQQNYCRSVASALTACAYLGERLDPLRNEVRTLGCTGIGGSSSSPGASGAGSGN